MKKQKTYFLIAFVLLNIVGCVYDELDDCLQGINVHFFSKSPCDANPVYPSLSGLQLFVFDEDGNLVATRDAGNEEITSHYSKTLKVRNGLFTVVAWGGLNTDAVDVQKKKEFAATRKDALFHLIQNASGEIPSPETTRIYFGESQPISLPDPAEYGSIFKQAEVNVQEVTNRLTVQIEGLPASDEFEVLIESENSGMNLDGSVNRGSLVKYLSTTPAFDVDGILQANLTTLQMLSGYKTALVIKNKTLGTELYRGDLLGTLLLKNPEVDLACDHDFTIRFTAADKCDCGMYVVMEIWVNNWLVHSYDADLD